MSDPTTDPEDITVLRPSDLAEVEVDEADELQRDIPIEADPADVTEQRSAVPDDLYVDEEEDG